MGHLLSRLVSIAQLLSFRERLGRPESPVHPRPGRARGPTPEVTHEHLDATASSMVARARSTVRRRSGRARASRSSSRTSRRSRGRLHHRLRRPPAVPVGAPARDARGSEGCIRPLHREGRRGPIRREHALPKRGPGGCGGLLPRLFRALSCGGTRHPRKPPLRSERRSQDAPPGRRAMELCPGVR